MAEASSPRPNRYISGPAIGTSFCLALLALYVSVPPIAAEESSAPAVQVKEIVRRADGQFKQGQIERAIAEWSRAARLLEQAGNSEERLEVLARRAEGRQAIGHFDAAIVDLNDALRLAEAQRNERVVAQLEGALGRMLFLTGETTAARKHLDACLRYATDSGDLGLRATTLNDLGNLLAAEDPIAARAAYQKASGLARDTGQATLAIVAKLNEARALLQADDPAGSERVVASTLDRLRALPRSRDEALAFISAARILSHVGEEQGTVDEARDQEINLAFEVAAEIAQKLGDDRTLALALGYRGALYRTRGRIADAVTLTRQALFKSHEVGASELTYRWQWQLARLHVTDDAPQLAVIAYRQAVDTLQTLRREMLGGSWPARRALQEDAGSVFLELADLLLSQARQAASPNAEQSLLLEARRTVELSKSVELENYFQDDCVAALQAKLTSVDALSVRAAAIYPILLDNRVELLVSLPGRMLRATSPAAKREMLASIDEYRALLARRTLQYRRPARSLYDFLLAPIEAELSAAGIETLVFVPSGALRTIPIAALHDGKRHLIEKYSIAIAPGLTLLDPRPLASADVQPLLGGVSVGVQGFEPLPHVATELQTIHRILGGQVYKDQGFVTASVQRALDLRPFTLVHLASHARFATNAKDSFLLTYDGRMNMDELEQFIKQSRFREEPVELLTLSACDTALGDERAALGLAGIAIKAGARSALASLWLINDQASAELVSTFYQGLATGLSKAKALQQAQVKMINDRRYRYPVYWAPFLMIGNWL